MAGVKRIILALFLLGAGLRIMLFWANPPENSYDDHFKPVLLIMKTGQIPEKDACWECYHPPVFYTISATAGKYALAAGMRKVHLPKLLQFLCCMYGILHVGLVWLILRKLPLSDFSRVLAFAVVCFLPAHIYISAIHSNDSFSYLTVALCLYAIILAIEKKLSGPWPYLAGVMMTVAIFTKYTALALLPAAIIAYGFAFWRREIILQRSIVIKLAITLLLPLIFLGFYCSDNLKKYGVALPQNTAMVDPQATHPRAKGLSFIDFNPVLAMKRLIIHPDTLGSFWTMLYSKMWFDVDTKFLYFVERDPPWWGRYYGWLRGENAYPEPAKEFSFVTAATGACLLGMGMIPLLLTIAGILRLVRSTITAGLSLVCAFFAGNMVMIILHTLEVPTYASIKAIYLLSSLPGLAACFALGVMHSEKWTVMRKVVSIAIGLLCGLVTLHMLIISLI